ncbi:MAG TPA: hypothetical protein PKI11_14225, partial [Candidatus Hydrogenedentes bacterium]|nr:hypothetical protein [Candidatus Hydrogenedentota bacterium]
MASLAARAALPALLCCCSAAHAQRLVVVTNTLSATREAARVYVHSIDFDWGGPLPGTRPLPGAMPLGPLLVSNDGPALLTTGPSRDAGAGGSPHDRSWHSAFQVAPFTELPELRRTPESGWREWIACAHQTTDTGDTIAVVLGAPISAEGTGQGRLATRIYSRDGTPPRPGPTSWTLPGRPVAAALAGGGRALVVCRTTSDTGIELVIGDLSAGAPPPSVLTLSNELERPGFAAVGLGVDPVRGCALVVASGYAMDSPAGEPVSAAFLVDLRDGMTATLAPVPIRGAGDPSDRVVAPGYGGVFWVTTRVPGAAFVYVTRLRVDKQLYLHKDAEYPLDNTGQTVVLAACPFEDALAVALGDRLEIWRNGDHDGAEGRYPPAVQALGWFQEGLFAGSAGRVSRIDPATAQPVASIQLQSGHVVDFAAVPRGRLPAVDIDADGLSPAAEREAGTLDTNPDSDGDGIPDGSDPEPHTPSPRLEIPAEITFRGKAVGYEIRALDFADRGLENILWRVEPDDAAKDWLVITPRSGRVPSQVYLAVSPLAGVRGAALEGRVRVHMTGAHSGVEAADSPAEVLVRVLPEPPGPQRVLWLSEDANAHGRDRPGQRDGGAFRSNEAKRNGMAVLAGLLAGPPFYYSHTLHQGPIEEPLNDFQLVILDARAAAQGAVTRQGLLDYVADGGALLFLGAHIEDRDTRSLTRW